MFSPPAIARPCIRCLRTLTPAIGCWASPSPLARGYSLASFDDTFSVSQASAAAGAVARHAPSASFRLFFRRSGSSIETAQPAARSGSIGASSETKRHTATSREGDGGSELSQWDAATSSLSNQREMTLSNASRPPLAFWELRGERGSLTDFWEHFRIDGSREIGSIRLRIREVEALRIFQNALR